MRQRFASTEKLEAIREKLPGGSEKRALELALATFNASNRAELSNFVGDTLKASLKTRFLDLYTSPLGITDRLMQTGKLLKLQNIYNYHGGAPEASFIQRVEKMLDKEIESFQQTASFGKHSDESVDNPDFWNKDYAPLDWQIPMYSEDLSWLTQSRLLQTIKKVSKRGKKVEGKPKSGSLYRNFRSAKDLTYLTPVQWVTPDTAIRIAKRELSIRVPAKFLCSPKDLVVLVDDSGSMHNRAVLVTFILRALFKYVLEGRLQMFLAPFEATTGKFLKISNNKEIKSFQEQFRPGGLGGTEIGYILENLLPDFRRNKVQGFTLRNQPEVLIINDGADTVKLEEYPFPVHVISIGEDNEELRALSINSGGEFHLIDYKGELIHPYEYAQEPSWFDADD